MNDPRAALEPSRDVLEGWLKAFSDFALEHIDGTSSAPASGVVGASTHKEASTLSPDVPAEPLEGGIEHILSILKRGVELSLNTTGPGYLAYIPGGGLFPAALADLVANVTNRFTGIAGAAPLFAQLESDLLEWLATEFGFGPKAHGLFTSGGSSANLIAFITARQTHFGDTGDFRTAVAYTSTQSHHSVSKGLRLAGIPRHHVRQIPTDTALRMDPMALDEAIRADLLSGLNPFLVVSAAGTTNTGAVDPLSAISQVARRHSIWHHVDGAYGGAFVLCAEGRNKLKGIARADSITFDPHKGLFLPYGTGCLLVADRALLAQTHQSDAEYLEAFENSDRGIPPSPSELGPELSRDYRGLRVWLPLMLFGADAFRNALTEKLALGRLFHDELQAFAQPINIIAPPELSVVAFRLAPRPGESSQAVNDRNQRWLSAVNARQRVHLSGTYLTQQGERLFTLRICALSYRTHEEDIRCCLEDLRATIPH